MQTYIRELIGAMSGLARLDLVAHVQADAAGELPPSVKPVLHPVAAGARRALEGLRPVGGASLVHGLDVDLPARLRCPSVITVHDLAVFDVPWAFPGRRAMAERWLIRRAVRLADAVIAVSSFTAARVAELFDREAVAIPLAPGRDFAPVPPDQREAVRAHYRLPERFVLHVGTVEPRKDVPALGRACRRARVPLVLAGAVADRALVPDGAVTLGYVERDELPALYGAASVVAYPSRYEGFGLPPVEAMACGAAVVATEVGGLPDVVGEGAVLVPPGDEAALASALAELVADDARRTRLAAAAVEAAGALSWRDTAAATLGVYASLGVGR